MLQSDSPLLELHSTASLPGQIELDRIRTGLSRLQSPEPVISIIIPAYNEERLLVRLLTSLANLKTDYPTELIIANNNSTDGTQEILDRCGARSIFVREQGVAYARQAGLAVAKGIYIVNGDADCWYPPTWIDTLVAPLHEPAISCTYGLYSFLPEISSSRLTLGIYEWFSERAAQMRPTHREFTNVLGMNFAFRRADGLSVGGFNLDAGHRGDVLASAPGRSSPGLCEDGWMALSLQKLGRIKRVSSGKARVWTSDRRLLTDGSLWQAFTRRLRRELKRQMRNLTTAKA